MVPLCVTICWRLGARLVVGPAASFVTAGRRQTALWLLLQPVDVVIEPERRGRIVDEMELHLVGAAGLERFPACAPESGLRGGFRRVDGFVALVHLAKHALEQHVRGIILYLIVRVFAGELARTADGFCSNGERLPHQRFHLRGIWLR